jgi:hypothetical protein
LAEKEELERELAVVDSLKRRVSAQKQREIDAEASAKAAQETVSEEPVAMEQAPEGDNEV